MKTETGKADDGRSSQASGSLDPKKQPCITCAQWTQKVQRYPYIHLLCPVGLVQEYWTGCNRWRPRENDKMRDARPETETTNKTENPNNG